MICVEESQRKVALTTMDSVEIIEPAMDRQWDAFVEQHPLGTLYHHSLWKDVIEQTYGYRPYYLAIVAEGEIVAGLPMFFISSLLTGKRLVSLPFSDYCRALTRDSTDDRRLISQVIGIWQRLGASRIELRPGDCSPVFSDFGFTCETRNVHHVLELDSSMEEQSRKFSRNCLRNARKACSGDLVMGIGENEEDLKVFYGLQALARRSHGLPPQPYAFFRNMWRSLHPHGMIQVLFAYHQSRPLAAILTTRFGDTTTYQYAGIPDSGHPLRPSYFLLWHAIRRAMEEGCRYFDFGRSGIENTGLIEFKRKWGAVSRDLPCYKKDLSVRRSLLVNREPERFGFIRRMSVRLPVCLLKLCGSVIYRHLG